MEPTTATPDANTQAESANMSTNTNSNTPAQAQTTEPTAATKTSWLDNAPEEWRKMIANNGGEDGFLKKMKSYIANPPKANDSATQPTAQPQTQSAQPQPTQPQPAQPQNLEGMMTPSDLMARQYFTALASEKKFSNISTELLNGEAIKDLESFGVPIMVNGNFNDAAIRKHLERYAMTKPAKPTADLSSQASSAPTVQYTEVPGGKITSAAQAYQVFSQPGHPDHQAAVEFMKSKMFKSYKPANNANASVEQTK